MVLEHLASAKEHVAEGKEHIQRQLQAIADLESGGGDTTLAREFLDTLEKTQAMHLTDRDRLTKELAKLRRERASGC